MANKPSGPTDHWVQIKPNLILSSTSKEEQNKIILLEDIRFSLNSSLQSPLVFTITTYEISLFQWLKRQHRSLIRSKFVKFSRAYLPQILRPDDSLASRKTTNRCPILISLSVHTKWKQIVKVIRKNNYNNRPWYSFEK